MSKVSMRGTAIRSVGLFLLLSCFFVWPAQAFQFSWKWKATGNLQTNREAYTATLLPNGKVLVAGGNSFGMFLSSMELYDPSTQTYSATGTMTVPRAAHTATLLSNGTVLLAGGLSTSGPTASAEIYDPQTGMSTATGSMNSARFSHTATAIGTMTGKVLIAGGDGGSSSLSTAEIYDQTGRTFATTGGLLSARSNHTATWLTDNNKILLTGGGQRSNGGPVTSLSSAELFNPANGSFATTGSMTTARDQHTATALQDGTVLITGGGISYGAVLNSAEIYLPTTGTFSLAGSMSQARENHSAVLLPNNSVVVAGGDDGNFNVSSTAEFFVPSTGTFNPAPSMNSGRNFFTLVLLPGGSTVLAPGGGSYFAGGLIAGIAKSDLLVPPAVPIDTCQYRLWICQFVHRPYILHSYLRDMISMASLPPEERNAARNTKGPLEYRIAISGLSNSWDVALFNSNGEQFDAKESISGNSKVLSVELKDEEAYRSLLENGFLAFKLNGKGEVNRDYPIEVRAEVVSRAGSGTK